jgi:hypothetical protein
MKILFSIFFIFILSVVCKSQTVGVSLTNIKAPPQYFPIKKEKLHIFSVNTTDNQQVVKNAPRAVPLVFSVEALPFFCKIEYKMGLNKKLPIKFRLGDVQYVDEMEGKH